MYHGRFLTDTTAIKVYQVSNENTYYFLKLIIALIAYSQKTKTERGLAFSASVSSMQQLPLHTYSSLRVWFEKSKLAATIIYLLFNHLQYKIFLEFSLQYHFEFKSILVHISLQNCSDIFFEPDSPSLPLLYRNVIELQQRSSSISFLFLSFSKKSLVNNV